MPIGDFEIVGSYNNQRVSEIDAERTVNMFQYNDALGKKQKSLINTSGLTNTNIGFIGETKGFRAQFVFNNNQFMVIGNTVFILSNLGVLTPLSPNLTTDTGYVGVDANTFQVIFVDGDKGYIYDTIANSFTQITDTSFPVKPIDVCTLDNFFVVANGDSPNFQLSMNDQGLVWGPASNTFTADDTPANNWLILSNTDNYETGVPIQFSTTGSLPNPLNNTDTYYSIRIDSTHIRVATSLANAQAGTAITLTSNGTPTNTITSLGQLQQGQISTHPGNIVACRTLYRRLFLFSLNFTEVWENQGIGTTLPFRRNNSLLIEYGTPCIGSVAVSFNTMCFMSQTKDGLGQVTQVNGTTAIPISTRALDNQLSIYASQNQISDCRAFLVKENGLIFYRMNFTAANHTWVYDITQSDPSQDETKLWHEEEVLDGDRHPAQTHAYFNGLNYVGHYLMPILYILDSNAFTNDGVVIRRMRITRPIVPPGYQRMRIDRLQVDLLQGNIANLQPTIIQLNLLTEDSQDLLTESGDDILLEQSLSLHNPQDLAVFMSISKDGGQSYGYRLRAPMGAVGQRTFRTLWRKVGVIPRGQAFVAKFEFFDAVPFIILGAAWFVDILPE